MVALSCNGGKSSRWKLAAAESPEEAVVVAGRAAFLSGRRDATWTGQVVASWRAVAGSVGAAEHEARCAKLAPEAAPFKTKAAAWAHAEAIGLRVR